MATYVYTLSTQSNRHTMAYLDNLLQKIRLLERTVETLHTLHTHQECPYCNLKNIIFCSPQAFADGTGLHHILD